MTVQTKPNMDVVDALKWRYSTKKFDATKKIPQDVWQQIEEALKLSPSSFGIQPYRFVVVTDEKLKKEMVAASWNQAQVADCSHFVVFANLTELPQEHIDRYVDLIASTRNVPKDSLQMMHNMMSNFNKNLSAEARNEWMAKQNYIALGNLMTVAAILGVDNCPMEGIVPAEIDRILGLKEKGCTSVVACALGYRASDDKYASLAKVRFPSSELFIHI